MTGYRLRSSILKLGVGLTLFAVFLLFIEFVLFYAILSPSRIPENVDLIAVFAGARFRVAKGYEMANQCIASYFTISPRNRPQLEILDERFKTKNCYQSLIEAQAQTTFQNALFVGKIVRKEHLKSVLLVTNAVHMPRSYWLLRLQLLGTGTIVNTAPVEQSAFAMSPLQWSGGQKKRVYNEMMEFWGSLFEMFLYHMDGRLSEGRLEENRMVSFLRSVLLFDLSNTPNTSK